ncbi:MAG: acyltransferase [Actinobacteria bacterium]|nr:acyltransferase [Actinomycetota bacterium]
MIRRRLERFLANIVAERWEDWQFASSITNATARGKKFKRLGDGSLIAFPWVTIYNEHYIEIGSDTMLGPYCALSAGMMPGQECLTSPVVRIGDRCLIGRGSGIVGHLAIDIGDDVWTGHHVYITDQNHGYEDVTRPISKQSQPEKPVRIGDGSWLGTGTVVLPGATIGKHVAVADFEGYVHWLDVETGAFVARSKTGGRISNAPVVVGDLVVFQDDEGRVTALRPR